MAIPMPMELLLSRMLETDKDKVKNCLLTEVKRSCPNEKICSQLLLLKFPSSASGFLYCAPPEATAPSEGNIHNRKNIDSIT